MNRKPPTQSQRLRAALYRVWEVSLARAQGMDQEAFYQQRLELIINEVVRELEPPPPDHE